MDRISAPHFMVFLFALILCTCREGGVQQPPAQGSGQDHIADLQDLQVRLFPRSSVSSTGASSHILIRWSMFPSSTVSFSFDIMFRIVAKASSA
jgi:hypothetical protein